MDNPPPHYPQLARAWTVCCVDKVSLLPGLELTTPALELLILFPKVMGRLGPKQHTKARPLAPDKGLDRQFSEEIRPDWTVT